jgi:hypothetical protein
VDLRAARFGGFLAVPAGAPFRFFLEDDRGVRYADANTSGERTVYLGLVPREYYYVRTGDHRLERRIEPSFGRFGRLEVRPESLRPAVVAARGSIAAGLERRLFAEPYGPRFYGGFVAGQGLAPSPEPPNPWQPPEAGGQSVRTEPRAPPRDIAPAPRAGVRVAGWTLLGAAALLAAGSVLSYGQALGAEAEFQSHVTGGYVDGLTLTQAQALETSARNWTLAGASFLATAGLAAAVAVVSLLWPASQPGARRVAFRPFGRGGSLLSLGVAF